MFVLLASNCNQHQFKMRILVMYPGSKYFFGKIYICGLSRVDLVCMAECCCELL